MFVNPREGLCFPPKNSLAKVFQMLSRVEKEADSAMFFSSTLLLKVDENASADDGLSQNIKCTVSVQMCRKRRRRLGKAARCPSEP